MHDEWIRNQIRNYGFGFNSGQEMNNNIVNGRDTKDPPKEITNFK